MSKTRKTRKTGKTKLIQGGTPTVDIYYEQEGGYIYRIEETGGEYPSIVRAAYAPTVRAVEAHGGEARGGEAGTEAVMERFSLITGGYEPVENTPGGGAAAGPEPAGVLS